MAGHAVDPLKPTRVASDMASMSERIRNRPSRWLLAISVAVVIGVPLFVWRARSSPERSPQTTAIVRSLCDAAIAGNRADDPTAGLVGPWRIAAATVDPQTGRFTRFRLQSGRMHLVAESAQLFVDPDEDVFGFELFDVVYTRVPTPDQTTEAFIHEMPHYVLGPAPYGRNIVDDGASIPRSPATPVALR